MRELHQLSASDLADAYRRGVTDPLEVTRAMLERIEQFNDEVGAFVHVSRRRAERDALTARAAIADGDPRPLVGVPCPIKDLTQVAGEPFEAGSAILRGNRADVTDGVAQRLAEAGTIMLGKTTTPEFGMPAYTEPAGQRPARSPWDTRRTAGGSSGGAGAALAAGLTPLAHGNDGGGSIRIPAAACGVVGLKPSRGRVSPGPYSVSGPGLATEGVLARTVVDAASALQAISGNRPGDFFTLGSLDSLTEDLRRAERAETLARCDAGSRVRVGVLTEPLNVETTEFHPEALAGVERAAKLLADAGCVLEEAHRPLSAEQWMGFMPLWAVGAASIPVPPEAEEHLMALTRWLRDQGQDISALDYANAVSSLQHLTRQIAHAWAEFDVILSPTLSGPPLPLEQLQLADPAADFEAQKHFTPFSSVWNITGNPAISLPLHRAVIDGVELPFGVHLGATRLGSEALLLRIARCLELADPWPALAPAYR
ncbi:amidase [Bowdeniella nasicola]|uniref:Amidase n=1 Tax=Bowdeniella nasicola TaxID=208480 RepID=A0A1H3ZLZ6_9ACTO|nr:amidase [Bowdeniella nasicola]SEA24799.1 amidase [Bowdeniella nasicola]